MFCKTSFYWICILCAKYFPIEILQSISQHSRLPNIWLIGRSRVDWACCYIVATSCYLLYKGFQMSIIFSIALYNLCDNDYSQIFDGFIFDRNYFHRIYKFSETSPWFSPVTFFAPFDWKKFFNRHSFFIQSIKSDEAKENCK